MNKPQSFSEFLATQSPQVALPGFLVNLVLAALLAWVLGLVYERFGRSLSDRRSFARNFLPITITTTLIITIVKSSLALSLGMVGALSIVRFRAAIKEPEELAYLFIAIGAGLGLGADQRTVTLAAFAFIAAALALAQLAGGADTGATLYLTLSSPRPAKAGLERIVETLQKHCGSARLRRFEESGGSLEADFRVEFDDFAHLEKAKAELRKLDEHLSVSFLDPLA